MAAPKRQLHVVNETAQSDRSLYGDPSLTREAMQNWREGQRRCRARRRHQWGPYTVYVHRSHYEVVEQCSSCRNRRRADFNLKGRKLSQWHPDYRDGYLLPKGAAPIDEDTHDELVLGDILSRKLVEARDEDDD